MQHEALVHPGDYLSCRSHIHQARARRDHALHRLLVGLVNPGIAQQYAKCCIAVARRGLPGHARDRHSLGGESVGEEVGTNIDDLHGRGKNIGCITHVSAPL